MTTQLSLAYDDRWRHPGEWARVMTEAKRVVDDIGLKQAAFDLDIQPSLLSHAVAERERHYLRAEWLIYLVRKDESGKLLAALADVGGWELSRRIELTSDQRLDRLESALRRLPDGVIDAIYRDAGVRR